LVVRNWLAGFGFLGCLFSAIFPSHCLLDPSLELVGSVLVKPHWVVFLLFVNPLPILILVLLEVLDINRRCIHRRLLVVGRQVSLPVRIHKVVVKSHKSMDLGIRPLVQVD
jgi:hypothetical protein